MINKFIINVLALTLGLAIPRAARAEGSPPPPIPITPALEPSHPPSIPLWPNGAPGSEARKDEKERVDWRQEPDIVFPIVFNIHNPSITPFIPAKGSGSGVAVIIAPGGGHMFLTVDREGYDLAKWLADRGIAAFVLKYRLGRDRAGNSPYKTDVEPAADALRAIRLVRSRAASWELNPDAIGILGFSAGGAAVMGAVLHSDNGKDSTDVVERQSSVPDFQVMMYAEVPRGDWAVPAVAPPAFLCCAYDDSRNAVNLANLFLKYQAAKVPAELHIYHSGGHGFGVRADRPQLPVSKWPDRLVDWLRDIGMVH